MVAVEHTYEGLRSYRRPSKDFSKLEQFKADTLDLAMDAMDIEKVDVVGHCEGAINATLLAMQHPERVRSLVLLAPGGIGKVEYGTVTAPFRKKITNYIGKTITRAVSLDTLKSLLPGAPRSDSPGKRAPRQPMPFKHHFQQPTRLVRELHAATHSRIDGVFGSVTEQGIPVGILQCHSDDTFPPERLESHIGLESVTAYASLARKEVGHFAFASDLSLTVGAIIGMLDSMNSSGKP